MKKNIFLSVLLALLICAGSVFAQEMITEQSGNGRLIISGKMQMPKIGSFDVTVPDSVNKSKLTFKSVTPIPKESGVEIAVFDGNDWVRATSKLIDGSIHWIDSYSGSLLDDYPTGNGYVSFRLPPNVQCLSIHGVIQQPLCGPCEVLALSPNDVSIQNNVLKRISAQIPSATTNSFHLGQFFRIALPNGDTHLVKYSEKTGLPIDPESGTPFYSSQGEKFAFLVDDNSQLPQELKMNQILLNALVFFIRSRESGLSTEDIERVARAVVAEQAKVDENKSKFILYGREWTNNFWGALLGGLLGVVLPKILNFAKRKLKLIKSFLGTVSCWIKRKSK